MSCCLYGCFLFFAAAAGLAGCRPVHRGRSVSHAGETFLRYTATGVFTTLIFWGFELGAEWWFSSAGARYAGGVAGLALGYWLKYRLDKQHVFREPSSC